MANEAKDLARRWCEEIFNEKNVAVCDEIMADRYVDHAAAPFGGSAPGEVNGPEHMRGVAAWLFGQFPDLRMEIEISWSSTSISCPLVRESATDFRVLHQDSAAVSST